MAALHTIAIRATYGLALVLSGAAALLPSAATAASDIYGLASTPDFHAFGPLDAATGGYTPIGGDTGLAIGYYAPVFDPALNSFFLLHEPIPPGASAP